LGWSRVVQRFCSAWSSSRIDTNPNSVFNGNTYSDTDNYFVEYSYSDPDNNINEYTHTNSNEYTYSVCDINTNTNLNEYANTVCDINTNTVGDTDPYSNTD
jgi:hypothetical protein